MGLKTLSVNSHFFFLLLCQNGCNNHEASIIMSNALVTAPAIAPTNAKGLPGAEKTAKVGVNAVISTNNGNADVIKPVHKRLTASIHGMSVGTERRFLNAIRQFGHGITPETRILKDGSALASGATTDPDAASADSTAGEFALKYLIGQSLKRRRKMMLRKGVSAPDANASGGTSGDAVVPEKLDLRSSAVQKRESKKAVSTATKDLAEDATTTTKSKKRKAEGKGAVPTDGGEKTKQQQKKSADKDGANSETAQPAAAAAAAAPKRKRVKVAGDVPVTAVDQSVLAPANVTPVRRA